MSIDTQSLIVDTSCVHCSATIVSGSGLCDECWGTWDEECGDNFPVDLLDQEWFGGSLPN